MKHATFINGKIMTRVSPPRKKNRLMMVARRMQALRIVVHIEDNDIGEVFYNANCIQALHNQCHSEDDNGEAIFHTSIHILDILRWGRYCFQDILSYIREFHHIWMKNYTKQYNYNLNILACKPRDTLDRHIRMCREQLKNPRLLGTTTTIKSSLSFTHCIIQSRTS